MTNRNPWLAVAVLATSVGCNFGRPDGSLSTRPVDPEIKNSPAKMAEATGAADLSSMLLSLISENRGPLRLYWQAEAVGLTPEAFSEAYAAKHGGHPDRDASNSLFKRDKEFGRAIEDVIVSGTDHVSREARAALVKATAEAPALRREVFDLNSPDAKLPDPSRTPILEVEGAIDDHHLVRYGTVLRESGKKALTAEIIKDKARTIGFSVDSQPMQPDERTLLEAFVSVILPQAQIMAQNIEPEHKALPAVLHRGLIDEAGAGTKFLELAGQTATAKRELDKQTLRFVNVMTSPVSPPLDEKVKSSPDLKQILFRSGAARPVLQAGS